MKTRKPYAEIILPACGLVDFFRAQNLQCEIGGSLRRQALMVGDIDIVVQAESLAKITMPPWLIVQRGGDQIIHGEIIINGEPVGVDIWSATPKQWGAFLWFISGPKELNISMRQASKRKGMMLSQHGLFRDGVQVDDGTERGVAKALGMPWMEPSARQKFAGGGISPPQKPAGKPAGNYAANKPRGIIPFPKVVVSAPEKIDKVTRHSYGWTCTCADFILRGKKCEHLQAEKSRR